MGFFFFMFYCTKVSAEAELLAGVVEWCHCQCIVRTCGGWSLCNIVSYRQAVEAWAAQSYQSPTNHHFLIIFPPCGPHDMVWVFLFFYFVLIQKFSLFVSFVPNFYGLLIRLVKMNQKNKKKWLLPEYFWKYPRWNSKGRFYRVFIFFCHSLILLYSILGDLGRRWVLHIQRVKLENKSNNKCN